MQQTLIQLCMMILLSDIVKKFQKDSVDFHQTVADMAGISRSQAKTINLGLFYGMGKAKLQAELGLSTKEKQKIYLINIMRMFHL
jgi:DNA polymerase I-like protein with 3'-5' exonuclease and polymerase domains